MSSDADDMPAINPCLPAMPFNGKDGQEKRPPIVADQIAAGDQVLGEKLREIMPVLDEPVLEDEIIIIPEHGVGQAIDIGARADSDEKGDGQGGKNAGVFDVH